MKKFYSFIYCAIHISFLGNLQGQNLLESRQTSYLTYVYQLADHEAIDIYRKGLENVKESYFHTLVDTYPTDSVYANELPPGHFLITWAEGEKLNFELVSISNVSFKVFNNGADLNIMLHDLIGNEITGAKVMIGKKAIPYNDKSNSYFLKGANKKGMLEVEYEGIKTFTYLDRGINNSRLRRFSRKILYTVPIKYLWIPVSVILQSPYDLYKTVRAGRPSGIFYYVVKPFKDIVQSISWGEPQGFVEKVFCPFDNYYCKDPQYEGYLVFNKPKYMPGDTVKFKAFITNKKGRPIRKKVNISLYSRYNSVPPKDFGSLSPYRKGGYEFQFPLHDSLRLKLDARYTVELEDNNFNTYVSGDFEYEEYELKSNQYEFRADKELHHKGQDLSLYASGTDINGLSLFDVQLEFLVLPKEVDEVFAPQVTIPDTLWKHQQKLESVGETKIVLPDSIFPKANMDYAVKASFTNAENETKYKDISLSYHHHKEEFVVEAVKDSLHFNYHVNGEAHSSNVNITLFNERFDQMETMNVKLPFSLKLNPFAFKYKIEDHDKVKNWQLTSASSQLEVLSNRSADSLFINVNNPRDLFFRYFIYEQNHEITKGSGTELNFRHKNRIKGKYFVSLHYVWAGEVVSENYEISFREKELKIKVFEPGTVFPGQESEIKIMVQDAAGNAVEDADLSAFAFTKKFERANIPTVPYFGKNHKNRSLINTFEDKGNELSETTENLLLNWQVWNARMQLDSIEYFRFLFPVYNYSSTIAISDTITQFAPYLVRQGEIQPIHIIYLDNRPVYFSVASKLQRYSFPVTPGYHQLRLRTNESEIKVDSVYFAPKVKNIFSYLMDTVNREIQITEKPMTLTDHENNLIKNHLIAVENDYLYARPSYLKQGKSVYWINQENNQRNTLFGPVFAGLSSFVRAGRDTIDFELEQRYHYNFQKNLIKMKYDENLYYSKFLNNIHPSQHLSETVLTEKQIKEIYEKRTAVKQASWKGFINPSITTKGKGRVHALASKWTLRNKYVKNFILLKDNEPQFLQIYAGSRSETLHNLLPGQYTLYALLNDNAYFKSGNIRVVKNATTYVSFLNDSLLLPDQTSYLINKKIKEIQETNNYSIIGRNQDFKEIKKTISIEDRVNRYSGETIFGVVSDASDGTALPGVNVIVKGSDIGTITNMDGEFNIVVPENYKELVFSFIGYMTEEVAIGAIREMNVSLHADIQQLSEVVVIGYGTQKRQSMSYSMSTIDSKKQFPAILQGRVAGVAISGQPNSSDKIQVKGTNTIDASSGPLYVIDGVPYSGTDLEISPDMIKSMEILKASEAAAIYGSRAMNGVVLITLKAGTEVLKTVMANSTFMEAMEASSSIRNNFSDYAYWKPKLKTDENGIASFKVKFPDDITAWKTHVLGMTDKKHSGQYEGEIKAFKTVAGTLATPAFLTEGDSAALIGKALNYTSDSLDITVAFEVDSILKYSANYKILHSNIDTLQVVAPKSDSVDFQYSITKKDGYFDGELRKVPVYKRGTKETTGDFYALEKDTVFTYRLPFSDKPFKVSATANVLEVLMEEADNIRRYEYLCNEQMASKVKALLVLKKIKNFQDDGFKYDHLLKKLVNDLQKNQRNQLWGWWPESTGSYWISLHVLEALLNAEKDGYKISLDKQPIIDLLVYNLEIKSKSEQLRILKILTLLEASFSYKSHLDSLEKKELPLADHIQIQLLRQALNLPYSVDSVLKYQKETMFGGVYWEEPELKVYSNTVLTTVYAYGLLKNSGRYEALLPKIRNYFLETRRSTGYWRNTYEASRILETILPDLLQKDIKYKKPRVAINGTIINEDFPFEIAHNPDQEVIVSRTGTGPVFLSVSQEFWNENPDRVEEDFVIRSSFDEDKTSFEAGKEVTLNVNLNLKKNAEYIMIEIPIPAGFSYVSKAKQGFEDHREHHKNKVNIYFTSLSTGNYDFDIKLLPRFSGSYQLNPAKAALMYFPLFYGRNEGKRVEVR